MSLPDTAEYWWDVKAHSQHVPFNHIKGHDCSHYHVYETDKLNYVDCPACLRHIKANKDLTDKQIADKEQAIKDAIKKAKNKSKKMYPNNPTCMCGFKKVRRQSKYGPFWGCTNYPNCKKTESIH